MPSARRQRKRDRKYREPEIDGSVWIICDRCGLLQPFRHASDYDVKWIVPCDGPLGLPCDGETATFVSDWARPLADLD